MITKIKFKLSLENKNRCIPSNFNSKLSDYWMQQLEDMFRNW